MSDPPTRICVFCSTTSGKDPSHLASARALAHEMYARSIHLVYGGGTTGMMGELAKTLVSLSGPDSVHGIIPKDYLSIERPDAPVGDLLKADKTGWFGRFVAKIGFKDRGAGNEQDKGVANSESVLLNEEVYGRTTVVGDVQVRKKMMCHEVAHGGPGSGFIGLSGGFGTMDELMEMVTWSQLGVHNRGICVLNVDGFWDGMLSWVEDAFQAGFVREEWKKLFVAKETPEECVKWLREYKAEG